ncbi:hypothetical protein ACFWU5_16880 [Nocardia sp. NPDC058640]|uniref:hypothetical protein n=1 Tax=Nocardia sp. NPDC058640 TaxID=3346571 RepID=UPI003654145B
MDPDTALGYHEAQTEHITHDNNRQLAAMGIVIRDPEGEADLSIDTHGSMWADIGCVTVHASGLVELWPRLGITPNAVDLLRGFGVSVFTDPPNTDSGWLNNGDGWSTTVTAAATGSIAIANAA